MFDDFYKATFGVSTSPKKETEDDKNFLKGKLLISMPNLHDGFFDKSVIYLCGHNKDGAIGIAINQPLENVQFEDILEQVNIKRPASMGKTLPTLYCGGPVKATRGFVLHSLDVKHEDTLQVDDAFGVTNSLDILRLIAVGNGPKDFIFALGYAGWDAGQLEEELCQNAWLVLDANPKLIFNIHHDDMWDKALEELGIDKTQLSLTQGRA